MEKKSLRQAVMDLLFPRRCPFCGKISGGALLCGPCADALPSTGEHPLLEGTFGRCAAPLRYEGRVRDAVLDFKFHGNTGGLDCFAELLADCAAGVYSGEFDTVTWVPVSKERRRQRGFDQSYELARAVCRCWGVEPAETLRKVWDNPPQSGIQAAEERRANVLGVYEAVAPHVWGRRILLIDDVVTTGATLTECARVLRECGAAEVLCLTLCRAAR